MNKHQFKSILVKAALDSIEISERDNQVPTRAVRIGNFCTKLRTELGSHFQRSNKRNHYYYSNILTKPSEWTDILVLRPGTLISVGNLTAEETRAAVEDARLQLKSDKSNISLGLTRLDKSVEDLNKMLKSIDKINEEAYNILEGFKELAQNCD